MKGCRACGVRKRGIDFPKAGGNIRRNVCSACLMSFAHQDDVPFIEAYLKRKSTIVITDIEDDEERMLCIKRTVSKLKKMVLKATKKNWRKK